MHVYPCRWQGRHGGTLAPRLQAHVWHVSVWRETVEPRQHAAVLTDPCLPLNMRASLCWHCPVASRLWCACWPAALGALRGRLRPVCLLPLCLLLAVLAFVPCLRPAPLFACTEYLSI